MIGIQTFSIVIDIKQNIIYACSSSVRITVEKQFMALNEIKQAELESDCHYSCHKFKTETFVEKPFDPCMI